MSNLYKIVIFVPLTHSDIVRKAMGDTGAGLIGNYSHCTWSTAGFGRYIPLEGAHPAIGEIDKFEQVEEERIETLCEKNKVKAVLEAIKKVHPYEEVAYDLIPLAELSDL